MVRPIYKPIQREKVSVMVRNQVKLLITDGKLKPGEFLPPERELIRLFNVSRPSLREALNSLIGMGLLEVTQGNRTVVKALVPERMFSPLGNFLAEDIDSVFELVEVRKAIETWNAYFAAERATPEDISRLVGNIESMRKIFDEGNFIPDNQDADFHLSIAMATHNRIQIHVMFTIFDILKRFIGKYYRSLRNVEDIFQQHLNILEAIKQKNCNLARRRIFEHLDFAESQFRELMKLEKGSDQKKNLVGN